MKKIYLALTAALILYSSHAYNKIPSDNKEAGHLTEYYSTIALQESPYPSLQGVVRLSKEEAMTRNHYRFTYDNLFRLESISFWAGDKLRRPNHTTNYFFTAPMQKIEYADKKEIITYYDRFGNQIKHRGAYKSVYSLDKNGRRVTLHYEDNKEIIIENTWEISNYKWNHQDDGSVIESRYGLEGNLKSLRPHFEFFRIRLYYEQNGVLALMQNIDEKGVLVENNSGVAQDKLLFDKEGRWLGWTVLNAKNQIHRGNGPNVAKGINIPDQYGYETGIRYEDIDGSSIINSHGFWGGKRSYDNFGNYKSTQFIDSLGNPGINEQTGYCFAVYTWDDKGINLLKYELLDVNKQPIIHKKRGYAKTEYEYNEFDQTTKISYFGINGEKINRKDNGVSYFIYLYNNGERTGTSRFNKEGEKL